jgi:hypothetical protein
MTMPMVIGLTVIALSETPSEITRKTQIANNAAIRARKSIEASFVRAGCNRCCRFPRWSKRSTGCGKLRL